MIDCVFFVFMRWLFLWFSFVVFLFLNHLLNPTMSKNTFRVLQPATVEQLLTNQLGQKTFIFGGFPSLNQFGLGVGLTSFKGQSINRCSGRIFRRQRKSYKNGHWWTNEKIFWWGISNHTNSNNTTNNNHKKC
mgnify:CR=1 FL=1